MDDGGAGEMTPSLARARPAARKVRRDLSDEQLAVVDTTALCEVGATSPQLVRVTSGAGSGKTTVLGALCKVFGKQRRAAGTAR
mmetsp:Transcript_24029/g.83391  ORF Transcript_24029/g.83391 Transcript_24029/m.83391 type:complete len:84 (-) Transcript_24029:2439-2690(-)